MTAAVGFPTLRLVRVRVGEILLGDMTPGAVLEVADFGVNDENTSKNIHAEFIEASLPREQLH